MQKLLLILLTLVAATSAQTVKFQLLSTVGHTVPTAANATTDSFNVGAALKIDLSKKYFIRPFFTIGAVRPEIAKPKLTPVLQGCVVAGLKFNRLFGVVVGGGVTDLMPSNKPNAYLPTLIVATTWRLTKNLGFFPGFSRTSRGTSPTAQIAYTFLK